MLDRLNPSYIAVARSFWRNLFALSLLSPAARSEKVGNSSSIISTVRRGFFSNVSMTTASYAASGIGSHTFKVNYEIRALEYVGIGVGCISDLMPRDGKVCATEIEADAPTRTATGEEDVE